MDEEIITAKPLRLLFRGVLIAAAAVIIGVFVWQGITAAGAPNPTTPHTSSTVAVLELP